jgi:hypothetical protein
MMLDTSSGGTIDREMLRVHKRGGEDMRPTTLRIFSVAILICVVSVVGFPTGCRGENG